MKHEEIEVRRISLEERRFEQEIEIKRAELDLKRSDPSRRFIRNPLVIAIIAGTIGLLGNALSTYLASLNAVVDAENQLVLAAVRTGDPDSAAKNLSFLLDTKLISDRKGGLRAYLEERAPGTGISLPAESATIEKRVGIDGLLDLIGGLESGNNYNAYSGRPNNTGNPEFTKMTVAKVMDWQKAHLEGGAVSSAAGRYQLTRSSIQSILVSMGLNPETANFDRATQDAMAVALLDRRGLKKFQDGTITAEQFAYGISKEWASLPIPTDDFADAQGQTNRRGFGFYAANGLNRALVSPEDVVAVILTIATIKVADDAKE